MRLKNIVLAETKDHADWELIGKIARQATDDRLRESSVRPPAKLSRKKTNISTGREKTR